MKNEMIEKFLDSEMTGIEEKTFFELLKNDPELTKEFHLRLGVNEAASEEDIMKLRETLQNLEPPSDNEVKECYEPTWREL